ncbi:MAG: ion channel [Syntrophomonas sp.]
MLKYRRLLFWLIIGFALYSAANLFFKMPYAAYLACLSVIGGLSLIIMAFAETQKADSEMFSHPVLGLITYEVLSFLSITTGYSSIYLDLARQHTQNFSGLYDGMSAFYFSLVTFATVGYGDIYPVTMHAKFWVMSEIWFSIVLIPIVIATSIAWIINQKQIVLQEKRNSFISNGDNTLRRVK